MYVPLAGGQLRARSTGLTQPRGPQPARPGRAPAVRPCLCPASGADRRLFWPDTSAAATTTHVQCVGCVCAEPACSDHRGVGRAFEGSEGWFGRVELRRALSRSLLGEKLRSFLPRKVAARLTMQKAFHGHKTEPGRLLFLETSPLQWSPFFVKPFLHCQKLNSGLDSVARQEGAKLLADLINKWRLALLFVWLVFLSWRTVFRCLSHSIWSKLPNIAHPTVCDMIL